MTAEKPGRRGRPLRKTCTVCQHPEVHRVEAERAAGVSLSAIAGWSGLHVDAISRHWHNHVSPERKAQYLVAVPMEELAQRANAERLSLMDYAAIQRKQLLDLFLTASGAGDRYGAATLSGRLTELNRFMGTLTGEVEQIARSSTTFNIHLTRSPTYAKLQQALLTALQPFPDAARAVIAELRRVEVDEVGALAPVLDIQQSAGAAHG